MKLLSIETTPNPNSMKLNLDERLAKGVAITYTHENRGDCPAYIEKILAIPGVSSVFRVEDFMAIQRKPTAGWEDILSQARAVLEYASLNNTKPEAKETSDNKWREVMVSVQYFRDLPMLVKVSSGSETTRLPLPERFGKAIERAMGASENMLMERKWKDEGLRYGELRDVGEAVVREISAVYDENKLKELVESAYHPNLREQVEASREELGELVRAFESPKWEERFAALKELGRNAPAQIDSHSLSLIIRATKDPKMSIRRLAVVFLGLIKTPEVLAPLCEALKDEAVGVRRSAGDALTDLGDSQAIGPMVETLKDSNKLVRWRASRFLYELGDESALPALREAQDDREFEVAMQIRQAIERIESGKVGQGPIWRQMTQGD
ncbi:MAG TPA: conserved virulence factor C family protein [Pyrinomonadaceae bacterium]|nr:conserved virulence factor C family protein [Pyrinomonadaceae bacterium]